MRTIYSFQEFYDDVVALAAQKERNYVSIKCQLSTFQGLEFSCYIDGYDYFSGSTPEEAIGKLRDRMFPPDPDKNHIDIEIPVSQTEILHAEESAHITD